MEGSTNVGVFVGEITQKPQRFTNEEQQDGVFGVITLRRPKKYADRSSKKENSIGFEVFGKPVEFASRCREGDIISIVAELEGTHDTAHKLIVKHFLKINDHQV